MSDITTSVDTPTVPPTDKPTARLVRILSFDPGTTVTGWAMSIYDLNNDTLSIHRFGKITPTAVAKKNKAECEQYTRQLMALDYLKQEVIGLIDFWKPDFVVSEDAFMNPRLANAYVALTLCLHVMACACRQFCMPLYKLAPKHVKLMMTNTGKADKIAMQEAVINNPNILIQNTKHTPLDLMTEHEGDAVGVAYAFTKQIPSILAAV